MVNRARLYWKANLQVYLPICYAVLMPKTMTSNEIAEFTQTIGLLVRRVRAAAAQHELSLTEASVLGRLHREGTATTAALARAEGIRPQSMRTTLAALEELALISRAPHPTDGRQVLISITEKGSELRKSMTAAKRNWLAGQMSQLNDAERETVFEAGRILKRMLNQ